MSPRAMVQAKRLSVFSGKRKSTSPAIPEKALPTPQKKVRI